MGKNVIQEKSYEFAVEVIKAYQMLKKLIANMIFSGNFYARELLSVLIFKKLLQFNQERIFFSSITKTTSEFIKR